MDYDVEHPLHNLCIMFSSGYNLDAAEESTLGVLVEKLLPYVSRWIESFSSVRCYKTERSGLQFVLDNLSNLYDENGEKLDELFDRFINKKLLPKLELKMSVCEKPCSSCVFKEMRVPHHHWWWRLKNAFV